MMYKRLGKYIFLIAGLLLIACSTQLPKGDAAQGRILLWHSWHGEEEIALQALLDKFHEVYPEIDVVAAPYDVGELKEEFANQVTQGLGPDLMIGDHLWTPDLVEAGYVRQVDEAGIDLSQYLSAAIRTLEYKGALFGLPLSVHTSALYFNRDRVEKPAITLQGMLEQAQEGHKVALSSNFADAFWGIRAFGGQVLDDQGKIILNEGGFSNWLDWLLEAQNSPNMIISNEQEWLSELFRTGEVDYYVGHSFDLLALQSALGVERLGVSPLPAGPNNQAGPLLQTESIFFSSASSTQQHRRALLLADFLTNVEQQRKLAQLAGRIPVHSQVRIDRRISPAVAGFVEQSKTAVPFRLLPQLFSVVEQGDEAYMQTLEGLVDASSAADNLTVDINARYGIRVDERLAQLSKNQPLCSDEEKEHLTVWHSWVAINAEVLQQIISRYNEECHNATVTLHYVQTDDLLNRYQGAVTAGDGQAPDLLLVGHQQIGPLHEAGLARPLDDLIDPSFLQRYPPAVSTAMRYGTELYGLPLTMNMAVLFYNPTLTSEKPGVLSDLLSTVSPARRFVMPYRPSAKAHWGIGSFGGKLFDASGQITLETPGFAEWLLWLKEAQGNPGIRLTSNEDDALLAFVQGDAAYLVADQQAIVPLLTQMGTDQIRTLPLPSGPEGAAAPLMDVEGLVINPETQAAEAAVELAEYLADVESQTQLMQDAHLIPANNNTQAPAHPAIDAFLSQAKTATVLPNQRETLAIVELGDTIYERVLKEGGDPKTVLADFSQFISGTYTNGDGLQQEAEALEIATNECGEGGQLLVWHSDEGVEAQALAQVAADFGRACPEISLELLYVPEEELPGRLADVMQLDVPATEPLTPPIGKPVADNTDEGANGPGTSGRGLNRLTIPDLILADHDLIMPLSEERLIKPMAPWIDAAMLIPYHSVALAAMRYKESLYGLPYAMETMALYVNQSILSGTIPVSMSPTTALTFLQEGNETTADSQRLLTVEASVTMIDEEQLEALTNATLFDLMTSSSRTNQFAMGITFHDAFWGIAAFEPGSAATDSQPKTSPEFSMGTSRGAPTINQEGLARWLSWLQDNQERPGLILGQDEDALSELFAGGSISYMVASSRILQRLRGEVSVDAESSANELRLTVLPLPDGPEGAAQPFLRVKGFVLPGLIEEKQAQLAVHFAQFASAAESQIEVASLTLQPPINALALTQISDSAIKTFADQATRSLPLPPRPWGTLLTEGGTRLFDQVLNEGQTPQKAVAEFITYLAETPLPSVVNLTGEDHSNCKEACRVAITGP